MKIGTGFLPRPRPPAGGTIPPAGSATPPGGSATRLGPRRAARDALTLIGIAGAVELFVDTVLRGGGTDQPAYWGYQLSTLYQGSTLGGSAARLYSPAFFQALAPLSSLPYMWFVAVWALIALAALVWMVGIGPALGLGVLWVGVVGEIQGGNIHMLMAAAIVIGFTWPEAWAFVLLTKVLPGLGLLWFPLRGEWRSFGRALAATAVVAGVSFVLAPHLWFDWVELLARQATGGGEAGTSYGPFSLPVRVLLAAVVLIWGARTDRRWTVPIVAVLASPLLPLAPSMLVACIPLARQRGRVAPPRGETVAATAPQVLNAQ